MKPEFLIIGTKHTELRVIPRQVEGVAIIVNSKEELYSEIKSLIDFSVYCVGGEYKRDSEIRIESWEYFKQEELNKRKSLYEELKKEFESN